MSLTIDQNDAPDRKLDDATIAALVAAVSAAKRRGWTQEHLRRWFKARGVETYKAAVKGDLIDAEAASSLSAISIHGLPHWPHLTNRADMAAHIEWLIAPARGAYDDALVEIAHDMPGKGVTWARLFDFGEIDQALDFADAKNVAGSNVYIGAALRLPDTNRNKRASAEDFYVATAVPIDIDTAYDATRAAMAAVCDDGMVVTTGLTPTRRSQHWTRLVEPCDSDPDFAHAFRGLVEHVGADGAVKDSARVMRLGGTISFPNERKVGLGYCIDLTTTTINENAKPSSLDTLRALAPGGGPSERRDYADRPQADGIVRGGITQSGLVENGRERFFSTKLLPRVISHWHKTWGLDPSVDELFNDAYAIFEVEAKNEDGRWTSPDGQKQLRARAANTMRRLRIGRMAKMGLYSYETGEDKEEAERVQANFEATHHKPPVFAPSPAEELVRAAPSLISGADFANRKMRPRPWLVADMIPGAQVTTLDGDGGLGKSTIGMQLCVAAVSGRSWLGQQVQRGPAIYLSSEDDADEVHRRLENLAVHYDLPPEALADFHAWPLAECDPALVTATRDDGVEPTARWHELEAHIEAVTPVLVVLDSRADVFGGNEISRSQARGFIGMLRSLAVRRQLTVLMLAHPSLSGMTSGTGSSGSTHWRNSVRAALYLTRPAVDPEAQPDPDGRVLEVKKSNYGPAGMSFKLRWASGAFEVEGSGIMGGPIDRAAVAADMDAQFLRMLAIYNVQGRPVSDRAGHTFAPAIFAKDPQANGATKAGFTAAMNRLFAAEMIGIEVVGPPSRQQRKVVRRYPETDQ